MSIKLSSTVRPPTRVRVVTAAIVALAVIGCAIWAGTSVVAAPSSEAEPSAVDDRLNKRISEAKASKAAAASRLEQHPIGDNLAVDTEGNLVPEAADLTDVPSNRTFRDPAHPVDDSRPADVRTTGSSESAELDQRAVAEVGLGIERPERPGRGERGDREDRGDGGDGQANGQLPTLLGYSTVRTATWALRQAAQGPRGSEASGSADREEARGAPAANGQMEERLVRVMEEAVKAERPPAGLGSGAATAGPAGRGEGASGRGEALYPALRGPVGMETGSLGDMRIGPGPGHVVRQGKFLDCALINRLRVDLADSEVLAQVTRDFVTLDGRYVLVPAGSKLLGVAGTVQNVQQARVYLRFDRIIFPDQRSAYFPERRVGALDGRGSVGVAGNVDRHLFLQFGSAVMLGLLDGFAAAIERPNTLAPPSARDLVMSRTSSNLGQVVAGVIARYANVVPTITLQPGKKMKVLFAEDVLLSPYMETADLSFVKAKEVAP